MAGRKAKQYSVPGNVKKKIAIEYMTAPYGSKMKVAEVNKVSVATCNIWCRQYKKFGEAAFTKGEVYPVAWIKDMEETIARQNQELAILRKLVRVTDDENKQ